MNDKKSFHSIRLSKNYTFVNSQLLVHSKSSELMMITAHLGQLSSFKTILVVLCRQIW